MIIKYSYFLILALCALVGPFAAASAAEPLLQPGKKSLYQRVLTRPGAELVSAPEAKDGKLIDAFSRFYLYADQEKDGKRWLQVGVDTRGGTSGWVAADQTVPWKQQLTLGFTNPAARNRMLFFSSADDLKQMLALDNPAEVMTPLVEKIDQGGQDKRVVAIEPDKFVDINDQFYLLPILDFEETYTSAGHKVKTLEVASVTKQELPPKKQEAAPSPVTLLESFRAAVVFVIDSTISMRPYIDETKKAVDRIYDRIKDAGVLDKVSFGLVAYRAGIEKTPKLEYLSKEFADPAEVRDADDFLGKVAALREASVSTAEFDEDAFAGIIKALEDIPWNRFGARYLILVTDAGALKGDKSKTGMEAAQIQSEAGELGIAIYALHLKTPEGRANHATAEATYRTLSKNSYLQQPLYFPVATGSVKRFGKSVDTLADSIIDNVRRASQGETVAGSAKTSQAAKQPAAPSRHRSGAGTAPRPDQGPGPRHAARLPRHRGEDERADPVRGLDRRPGLRGPHQAHRRRAGAADQESAQRSGDDSAQDRRRRGPGCPGTEQLLRQPALHRRPVRARSQPGHAPRGHQTRRPGDPRGIPGWPPLPKRRHAPGSGHLVALGSAAPVRLHQPAQGQDSALRTLQRGHRALEGLAEGSPVDEQVYPVRLRDLP